MKFAVVGFPEIALGKHSIKDVRLDQVHKLVEADKKVYAQVDVVGEADLLEGDAILVAPSQAFDIVFKDLEFVETRLSRSPGAAEAAALEKLKKHLESEQPVSSAALSADEKQAVAGLTFVTSRAFVVPTPEELEDLDRAFVRAFREAGYLSFLTVGGKENRVWPIRAGATAWEAAGTIHSDIQKGFIRAEVIGFADLIAAGGETQAKRAGKQRLETKTYVVQDYDVINFRFNK
jgi:ribosome-binding ATPase